MKTLSENYLLQKLEDITSYFRPGFDGNKIKTKRICECLENRYSLDLCYILSKKFDFVDEAVKYVNFLENESKDE